MMERKLKFADAERRHRHEELRLGGIYLGCSVSWSPRWRVCWCTRRVRVPSRRLQGRQVLVLMTLKCVWAGPVTGRREPKTLMEVRQWSNTLDPECAGKSDCCAFQRECVCVCVFERESDRTWNTAEHA